MSKIVIAAFAVASSMQRVQSGFGPWWNRCGRRLRLVGALLVSGLTILGYAVSAGANYIHNEVSAQIAPIAAKMDLLHADVLTLQTNFTNVIQSSVQASAVSADVGSQLTEIKSLLQALQKRPATNTAR